MNEKQQTIKKIITTILISFITFSLTVFIYDFIQKTNFENTQTILYGAGTLFGLLTFFSLALLITSGELARFFDKYYGIDNIIKTQRKFSILVTLLAITHPVLFIISNTFWARYLIPDFATLPLATGTIALYLLLIIQTASMLYKRISQTTWQYLHIVIYALFFTASYHMINQGTTYNNNTLAQIIFNVLFAGVLIGIIYRTQYKIRKHFKEKPRIKKIKTKTESLFW